MAETLRSSGRISIAVGLSRVLGLARESLFAALFGAGALADAYQVAFRIPNLLRDLFAEGALSSAFVPTFTASLLKDDPEASYRLGNLALCAVLLATGTLSLLGIVFAEEVVWLITQGSGDPDKTQLAVRLTRVMMPLLAVVSASAVWMGMLNAQKRFTAPAYAPAMFNVTSILVGGVLLFAALDEADTLLWWSVGTLVAGIAQAFFQLPALWRLGYRPRLPLRGLTSHPGIRRIARLMAPALVGLAAVQINIFINTGFAYSLGDGPVAQLGFGFRVFYLPIGLFSVALATVTTTRVSEDAARKDYEALKASTAEGLGAVWMLMSASAVGLAILAEPTVQLLFERGAFSRSDSIATGLVLQAYAVGLVPYGLVKILAPVFYGIDRARIPLAASVSAVAANLGFNFFTYEMLGAPGLALGMGVGALVNVTVLRLSLRKILGPMGSMASRLRGLASLALANAIMGAAVWGGWWWLAPHVEALSGLVRQVGLGGALFVVIGTAFFVYVGLLRALGYPGAAVLWQLPSKILRRLRGR